MRRLATLTIASVLAIGASMAHADTVSCNGKRSWQRDIVLDSVHRWFSRTPRRDSLIELVQAEHGIVACSSNPSLPQRLHTTLLPHGLELDRFGALLLANELEWSGLIPPPEDGLAGEFFRVRSGRAPEGSQGSALGQRR
jgi:hypothetical protein